MQLYPNCYQNNYTVPYQQNQSISFNNLPGRIVRDFSGITASEIPMDGRMATFIKSDFSEIELRKWENNGTISNFRFKAVLCNGANNMPTELTKCENGENTSILNCIRDDISVINEKLDKLIKPARGKNDNE